MRTRWISALAIVAFLAPGCRAQVIDELTGSSSHHCSVRQTAPDGKTLACQVWNNSPELFTHPMDVEIYRNRRCIVVIQPGGPITEWHFWKNGAQISVSTENTRRLYDTSTGNQIAQVTSDGREGDLPTWAKSRTELDDESVPDGPAFAQQRTLWIGKVLRRIEEIHPGMTRADLESMMKAEGGISTRQQRTYVYIDCPYIKVDVVFAPSGSGEEDDTIVSVSRPYLAFSIMD